MDIRVYLGETVSSIINLLNYYTTVFILVSFHDGYWNFCRVILHNLILVHTRTTCIGKPKKKENLFLEKNLGRNKDTVVREREKEGEEKKKKKERALHVTL